MVMICAGFQYFAARIVPLNISSYAPIAIANDESLMTVTNCDTIGGVIFTTAGGNTM